MGHPVGKPDIEEYITIPVLNDWVVQTQKSRYVFVGTFLSKIRQLSVARTGTLALYHRVIQTFRRGWYNTAMIYGVEAIDIDNPHCAVVSAWLKFTVVKSTKDPGPCTFGVVQKKKI